MANRPPTLSRVMVRWVGQRWASSGPAVGSGPVVGNGRPITYTNLLSLSRVCLDSRLGERLAQGNVPFPRLDNFKTKYGCRQDLDNLRI